MALSVNPRLLILDEPTTGLDATVEAEILDLIEELQGRINAAILLITHNLGLVRRLCSRVGVLYAGRLVEEGPARDIFTDPRHPYTMGLMRCVPTLRHEQDRCRPADDPRHAARPRRAARGVRLLGALPDGASRSASSASPTSTPGRATPAPRAPPRRRPCRLTPPPTRRTTPTPWARAPATRAATSRPRSRTCRAPPRCSPPAWRSGARDQGDVLEIDDVVRTFKDGRKQLTAVADVSLGLRKGETFGLVGESGSGKTTLAKCVTGLLAPDSGTVTFEGDQLKATAGKRSQDALRAIQMVFQNPDSTLNPAWSTRQILTRAVRKLGGGKDVRAKVDKLSAERARRAPVPAPAADRPLRRPEAAHRHRPRLRRRSARWSSATSRRRRSTSPCRRASSTCSSSCRPRSGSPTCSSATTWPWCATSRTASGSCTSPSSSRSAPPKRSSTRRTTPTPRRC